MEFKQGGERREHSKSEENEELAQQKVNERWYVDPRKSCVEGKKNHGGKIRGDGEISEL